MPKSLAKPHFLEETVGDDLVIYDGDNNRCHALQPKAAHVYRQIQAGASRQEIVSSVAQEFGCQLSEAAEIVDQASVVLEDAELIARPAAFGDLEIDRRRLLQVAGGALLCSVFVATPAAAASTDLQILFAGYGAFVSTSPGFPTTTLGHCGTPNSARVDDFNDVTVQVQAAVIGDTLSIGATNGNFGDPIQGTVKELRVIYRCPGSTVDQFERACENTTLNIDCTP